MNHINGEPIKFAFELALGMIAIACMFALAIAGNWALIELGLSGKLVGLPWYAVVLMGTTVGILNWGAFVALRSALRH